MKIDKLRRSLASGKWLILALSLILVVLALWNGVLSRGPAVPTSGETEAAFGSAVPAATDLPEPLTPEEEEAQAAAAYFAAYRLDREEARSAELLALGQIIENSGSSPEAVAAAEERRLRITGYGEKEYQAESLLSAKGLGETVVILGEQRATVIVDVEMSAQRAAQIAEAVDSVSGCGFENVVVVNR